MCSGVALEVLKPWPLKLIVDHVLTSDPLPDAVTWLNVLPGSASPTALLGWLAGATVLLFLILKAVGSIQRYVQAGVGSRMVYELGENLFEHLQRLSLRFHGQQRTGDLVRRITTDSGCIRELVIGVGLHVLTSLVSLMSMFIIMWNLDRSLSLLALLVLPFIAVMIKVFDKPMTERTYQHQQLEGEMMALAEQTFTALPVVQAFNREDYEDMRFRNLSNHTLRAYLRAILAQVQFSFGVGATTAMGTAAIMVIGGFQVLEGKLTVGALLVFLSYLASLYSPMETLAYLFSGFASAAARARRVLEVLDADEGVRDAPGAEPLSARRSGVCGHVCFEDVTFGYEPGRPVLRGVTLEACPGETVALVGSTGTGKSTLVSLIPRFFDTWEGRVTFDGVNVREVQLDSLRAHISIVLQEPYLLPLTVAENIAYGCPGASRDEITAAAVTANADEFIRQLPDGYDTVLGERGATLSGGQRQRLAIARALLKNAPVLILDEPTSALDAETEALLLEALERLMKGRTTFIIAHRLSTIQQADKIVVLEKGRVAETGTHDELLTARGAYQSLYEAQFRATSQTSLAA
jgi:ATP-binding cassette subfamily B protein/subfamily B ATP-binding cassette protein MsbA